MKKIDHHDRFSDPAHIKWAKQVKDRDNYTCLICNKTNIYLNSHHLYSFDSFIDKRFSLDNGVTLCQYHHDLFHFMYGHGNNTEQQFVEFYKICKQIKNIVDIRFSDGYK